MSNLTNSTSLWGSSVKLSGAGFTDAQVLAYLVLSCLAFVGVLLVTFTRDNSTHEGNDAVSREKAFGCLLVSMILFLLSYALQIIDIVLHNKMIWVLEGYFFILIFRDGTWQISDILVILILCRITYYQFPLWGAHQRGHEIWRQACFGLLTILSALALYRFALTAAYIILILNGNPYAFVMPFLQEEVRLSLAYHSLYSLVLAFILGFTAYYLVCRTKMRSSLDIIERNFTILIMFSLIRSMTRAIIIVRYDLQGYNSPYYLTAVSEGLYGLLSVLIYYTINILHNPAWVVITKNEILREGRQIARKEFKRRRIDANKGGPPLPTPGQLRIEMENKPFMFLPVTTEGSMGGWFERDMRDTMRKHIQDVLALREKI